MSRSRVAATCWLSATFFFYLLLLLLLLSVSVVAVPKTSTDEPAEVTSAMDAAYIPNSTTPAKGRKGGKQTTLLLGYISALQRLRGSTYKRQGRRYSGAISYAISIINNASILPPNYKIAFKMMETYGENNYSIKNTAILCVEGEVSAIIGPQESCYTEGKIAASFNMPMISFYCDDKRVSNNLEFSTFIRTRPKAADIARGVASLLLHFNWTKIAYITTTDTEYAFFVSNIKQVLIEEKIDVLVHKSYEHPYLHGLSKNSFMDIVEETYRIARIYVIVGEYYEPVGLLHNLQRRGLLDTGQYFVIGVDKRFYKYNKPRTYINTWGPHKEYMPETSAFRAYLHVTLRGPSEDVRELERMNRYYLTQPPFNLTLTKLESKESKKKDKIAIQPETGYLYDSVILYANTVGKILREGLGKPNDGRLVAKLLKGKQYMSSLGYLNRINENGDAVGNYTVLHLHNGALYPVGMFEMTTKQKPKLKFKLLKNKKIVWIGGDKPQDEPKCGFDGKKCKTEPDNTPRIVLPIFATLFVIALVVGVFVYRNRRFEQELDMLLWKIDAKDMEPLYETQPLRTGITNKYYLQMNAERMRRSTSDLHSLLQQHGQKDDSFEKMALIANETTKKNSSATLFPHTGVEGSQIKQFYTQVCRYKRQIVAVKRVYKSSINMTRIVKKELKVLRDITNQNNQNLTKFMGACVDDPNICVVWEYCERGSLQDILYNDDLSLEHMFIASLVFDIIRGLGYLHESDIRFHGNLKSSNCVVDSRWVLKLTDFSLNEFKSGQTLDHLDEQAYFNSLFWQGPEFLRYMVSKKPYGSLTQHMARLVDDLRGIGLVTMPSSLTQLDATAYQRSDIYSFGIILYELFSREFPYSPTNHSAREIIRRVIVLNDRFHVPYRPKMSQLSTVDKYITDCIVACLAEDAAARPNIKQIRNRLKMLQSEKNQNIFDNMMNLMETYAKNLERLVSARTGQLQEEKKRTEELLYQMLPVPVAEQLKRGKQVEAEAFDCVTIYFSDIVGFTELSAGSTPFEVVQLLNDLYTTFDSIIAAYDVYKVETIGDAYMVVSGLPKRNDFHAGEIASMSLRLLNVINLGFTIRHRPSERMKLRIGIHSGPCCAGVVGTRMPRYCLFGDTVNTASRMESNGEPYKIHISESCKLELDRLGGYRVQDRGEIAIKGKGSARTYWLIGKTKPSTHMLHRPSGRQRKQPCLRLSPLVTPQVGQNNIVISPDVCVHSPMTPSPSEFLSISPTTSLPNSDEPHNSSEAPSFPPSSSAAPLSDLQANCNENNNSHGPPCPNIQIHRPEMASEANGPVTLETQSSDFSIVSSFA